MELKEGIKAEVVAAAYESIGEELGWELNDRSDKVKISLDAHFAALKEACAVWLRALSGQGDLHRGC
jgi:hypothetical protein